MAIGQKRERRLSSERVVRLPAPQQSAKGGAGKRKAAADLTRTGKLAKGTGKPAKGQEPGGKDTQAAKTPVTGRAALYQTAIEHDLAFQGELAKKLKSKRVRMSNAADRGSCSRAAPPVRIL